MKSIRNLKYGIVALLLCLGILISKPASAQLISTTGCASSSLAQTGYAPLCWDTGTHTLYFWNGSIYTPYSAAAVTVANPPFSATLPAFNLTSGITFGTFITPATATSVNFTVRLISGACTTWPTFSIFDETSSTALGTAAPSGNGETVGNVTASPSPNDHLDFHITNTPNCSISPTSYATYVFHN